MCSRCRRRASCCRSSWSRCWSRISRSSAVASSDMCFPGLCLEQLGRVERINDRAEAIQGRAARAVKFILWVAIPLVLVLFVLMFRPYLRGWLS